jgi:transposase InsO family protein
MDKKLKVRTDLLSYWPMRAEFAVHDGLLLKVERDFCPWSVGKFRTHHRLSFVASRFGTCSTVSNDFIKLFINSKPSSNAVINHLKSIFARHGILQTFISDNGPQYCGNGFREFAIKLWI